MDLTKETHASISTSTSKDRWYHKAGSGFSGSSKHQSQLGYIPIAESLNEQWITPIAILDKVGS